MRRVGQLICEGNREPKKQKQKVNNKKYPQVSMNNGTVFMAREPEEEFVQSLVEPDPNDPIFKALCLEVEAQGFKLENNPLNKNPSYLFDDVNSQIFSSPPVPVANEVVEKVTELTAEVPILSTTCSAYSEVVSVPEFQKSTTYSVNTDVSVQEFPKSSTTADSANTDVSVPELMSEESEGSDEVDEAADAEDNIGNGIDFEETDALVESMKIEVSKPTPNVDKLMKWMKMTYPLRYQMVKKEYTTKKIFEVFPAIKFFPVEFFCVSEKYVDGLTYKLDPLLEKLLLKRTDFKQEKNALIRGALQELAESKYPAKSASLSLLRKNVGMLLFCDKLLGSVRPGILFINLSQFRKPELDIPHQSPFIVLTKGSLVGLSHSTSMDIYVERNKMFTTSSFYKAVLTLYMLYWIFWMEYQDSTRAIFEKFEELLDSD